MARSRDHRSLLWHPLPLAATLLLALNDQLLKPAFAVTPPLLGKLSDVCGLFVFPLLLVALVRLVVRRASWRIDAAAVALSAAGFAGANLWPRFNALLGALWIDKLMDVTDLWALAALLPSAWWLRRCRRRAADAPAPPLGRWLALAAVLLACAATQPPRHPRAYAVWQLPEKQHATIGPAALQAWVSKSGKTGCGVTLRIDAPASALPVTLVAAELRVAGGVTVRGAALPRVVAPRGGQGGARTVYVAFAFDNNAAWNAGHRRAELRLAFDVAGRRYPLRVAARQVRPANHRFVPRHYNGGDPGIQSRHPGRRPPPPRRSPGGAP